MIQDMLDQIIDAHENLGLKIAVIAMHSEFLMRLRLELQEVADIAGTHLGEPPKGKGVTEYKGIPITPADYWTQTIAVRVQKL